jgi:type III pantothenate kinase
VDAVDGGGMVCGGYIFPGPEALAHGLASKTGLPLVPIADPGEGIGTGTLGCIERGIVTGSAGAIRALIESACREANCSERVIVTGGWGEFLMRRLALKAEFRSNLVLEGLGSVSNFLPVRA